MTTKRIRLIYGIVLSVALVVAGILLMVACVGIYRSGGEQIYTSEKVAKAFAPIAVPVWLAVALCVGGFILDFSLPSEKIKVKLGKNEPLILKKLHEKNDYTKCGDEKLRAAIEKEQKARRLHKAVSWAVLLLGSLIGLLWFTDSGNHAKLAADINGFVIDGFLFILPCVAIPFGYGVFAAYFTKASIRREIALMKLVAAPREVSAAPREKGKLDRVLVTRWALLCAAVACAVYGFAAGGWLDVLTKAVNICTECVGLG